MEAYQLVMTSLIIFPVARCSDVKIRDSHTDTKVFLGRQVLA